MPRLMLNQRRLTFSLTPLTLRPPPSMRFPIRPRPILTITVVATLTTTVGILTLTARRFRSVLDLATAGTMAAAIAAGVVTGGGFAAGLAAGGMAAGDMAAPVGTTNCGRLAR